MQLNIFLRRKNSGPPLLFVGNSKFDLVISNEKPKSQFLNDAVISGIYESTGFFFSLVTKDGSLSNDHILAPIENPSENGVPLLF